MSPSAPPAGVWVPVPTFFVSKSSPKYVKGNPPLDLDAQTKHSLFLAKAGIKGLLLLGSTGEAISLTNNERRELIQHVRTVLNNSGFPKYPLMAGTATQGLEDTLTQLKDAYSAGADYGCCLAPGYFAGQVGSGEGMAAWFEAVADESPLPILIYHYPGVSNGIRIPVAVFERLSKHPNIVGCKLSHGDISTTAQIALSPEVDRAHFATFTGLGQQLLPVLSVGGAGAIDALSGVFPRSVVAIYNSYVASSDEKGASPGRLEISRNLQRDVSRAEELVVRHGTVGIKTAASKVLGLGDHDGTRLPLLGGLSDAQWAEFEGAIKCVQEHEEKLAKEGSV